jgi:Domain of unknown function (DUF1929)/Kelch motif
MKNKLVKAIVGWLTSWRQKFAQQFEQQFARLFATGWQKVGLAWLLLGLLVPAIGMGTIVTAKAQSTYPKGVWSRPIAFPSVPVAAAVLPTGKVLTWSSWDRLQFGGNSPNQTYTTLFDPKTNQVTESLVTNTQHDMFCPGTSMLGDGRVLVNGGGPYVPTTSIFDANNNTWTKSGNMNQKRWYNVTTTLPDGNAFTLGGNRVTNLDGRGERWNGSTWRTLTGAVMDPLLTNDPKNRAAEHPHLFVAPNGKVFIPGPTQKMQWYDVSGNGSIQAAGDRGGDFSQNGTFTMYNVGKILIAGGNPNYDGSNAATTPSTTAAYEVDLNSGQSQPTTPMRNPRAFANSVVMPDGKVMVVGGLNNGKAFSDSGSILTPEMYDPQSKTWTDMAPMAIPRNYHSVALLLPDGRVMAGGGGLCGPGCSVNHADAEIFSPPYLFTGSRPRITSAPQSVSYNQNFTVQGSNGISKFTLIRMSSVTHSVNTDQRFKTVNFTRTSNRNFRLNLNSNANITPPGYYMLFGLNNQGTPSVSRIMKVG